MYRFLCELLWSSRVQTPIETAQDHTLHNTTNKVNHSLLALEASSHVDLLVDNIMDSLMTKTMLTHL